MSQPGHKTNDYDSFVAKFQPKKTTDDCNTPDELFQKVEGWALERYDIGRIVRPYGVPV